MGAHAVRNVLRSAQSVRRVALVNISQQSPRSLAQHVRRSLAQGMVLFGLLAAVAGATAAGERLHVAPPATDGQIMDDRPHAEGSPAALMERHNCWTGPAPADMAGTIPGHVIVTVDGETRGAGRRMVGKALSQVFNGVDHGLTVRGFCR